MSHSAHPGRYVNARTPPPRLPPLHSRSVATVVSVNTNIMAGSNSQRVESRTQVGYDRDSMMITSHNHVISERHETDTAVESPTERQVFLRLARTAFDAAAGLYHNQGPGAKNLSLRFIIKPITPGVTFFVPIYFSPVADKDGNHWTVKGKEISSEQWEKISDTIESHGSVECQLFKDNCVLPCALACSISLLGLSGNSNCDEWSCEAVAYKEKARDFLRLPW